MSENLSERFERGRNSAKRGLLFRTRNKIAQKLRKLLGVEDGHKYEDDAELDPDPLFETCREDLPAGLYGRLGLFYREMKRIPRFSEMLFHPQKTTLELEECLEEAMDVYPVVTDDSKVKWLPGFVFVVNDKMFVYTSIGNVEETSVLVLRTRSRVRFVYELDAYVKSMHTGGSES